MTFSRTDSNHQVSQPRPTQFTQWGKWIMNQIDLMDRDNVYIMSKNEVKNSSDWGDYLVLGMLAHSSFAAASENITNLTLLKGLGRRGLKFTYKLPWFMHEAAPLRVEDQMEWTMHTWYIKVNSLHDHIDIAPPCGENWTSIIYLRHMTMINKLESRCCIILLTLAVILIALSTNNNIKAIS